MEPVLAVVAYAPCASILRPVLAVLPEPRGYRKDSRASLLYIGARWYDPVVGTWDERRQVAGRYPPAAVAEPVSVWRARPRP